MDCFTRALITADNILQLSGYKNSGTARYSIFDNGKGKEFEEGNLTPKVLRVYAAEQGEPAVSSGRQEYLENIIN